MYEERRKWPRYPRFLRTAFRLNGLDESGITLDISVGGAFLNTTVYPPTGSSVALVYAPAGSDHLVTFEGKVMRVVGLDSGESVAPGLGLQWTRISANTTPYDLSAALSVIFRRGVVAKKDANGEAYWTPDFVDTEDDTAEADNSEELPDWLSDVDDRQKPRAGLDIRAQYFVQQQPYPGRIRAISHRGMYIETASLPAVGDVCVCSFPLPDMDQTAKVVSVVTRVEEVGFATATLSVVDDECRDAYKQHISELLG